MTTAKTTHQDFAQNLQDIRRIPGIAELRRGIIFSWLRRMSLLVTDVTLMSLAWGLAEYFCTATPPSLSLYGMDVMLVPVLCMSVSIFAARNLYRAGAPRRDYLGLFKAQSLSVMLLLLLSSFYNPDPFVSRSHVLVYWVLSLLFVCLGRFGLDAGLNHVRDGGTMRYPVGVIASPEHRTDVLNVIHQEGRYQVASLLDASALDRYKREYTFQKLQSMGIVEVFVAWDAIHRRMFLGQRFQALGLTLRVIPDSHHCAFGNAKMHMLNEDIPCITFFPPMVAGISFWTKRLFDIGFALGFLILTAPIYLAIAIAVYLDSPGPVFYKQTRIGLHGQPFQVWKFRSMVTNADKLQAQLEKQNQNKDGVLFKMKDDPRITRVGHFIRQYSLDELPQIFNVLLGEMSLVGPRPLPLRDVEKFRQHYFIRQDVLPGITGMWQVSGRSDIDNFEDVLKLDLDYIQHWSLWLDVQILFKTFSAVLQKSGAY
jgi:exopolysaccharide biosynthesis polyprenyl glycosylphosphotransferase